MTTTLALKFLAPGGVGPYSEFKWPLPRGNKPGKWVKVDGDLIACKRGIHACTIEQALDWLEAECYVIELRDARLHADPPPKLLAPAGRLIRRLDWDPSAFATACARRAVGHAIKALEVAGLDAGDLRQARRRKDLDAAQAATQAAPAATRAAQAAAEAAGAAQDAERRWQVRWLRKQLGVEGL